MTAPSQNLNLWLDFGIVEVDAMSARITDKISLLLLFDIREESIHKFNVAMIHEPISIQGGRKECSQREIKLTFVLNDNSVTG